jgi:zinc transport system substrate-binding protein
MESFLEKAAKQNPKMKTIEASNYKDINLLKNGDEENPHVWLSVTYSIAQVKAITAGLCEADPAHKDAYRKNALDYCMKLEALKEEMHGELDNLPHKDIVTFHEAFPYLAKEFKLNIVSVIEREPGTEPTPQELEDTIKQVNGLTTKVLFTEPQYSPAAAETIARETGAKVYQLDPIVTGEANESAMDAYIDTMKKNMAVLKEALQ